MLNALMAFFNKEEALVKTHNVISSVLELVDHFEQDKLKEGSNRNAAIDVLIELLQAEKIPAK